MSRILRPILSRWILSLIGVALIAVLIWWFGPFIAALESVVSRVLLIAVLLLIWAGANLWLDLRRRRADRQLVEGVTRGEPNPTAVASAEEAAKLREKLTTALALLRKTSGKRGYLYEQPWYVFIGPPGAGKTTALLNAGLKFPLAAEMGQQPVAGVGGTRLCDWMFTEDAVLIDTAGRYTTQDSDEAVDRAGWTAFLDLLRQTRARQPLNGVIVAISLAEIAGAPQAERLAHARAIRRRIKEIYERLGVRVPVYAIFTKADLIAGFTEFFDDLDRERRTQVWGTTFPLGRPEAGGSAAFAAEFRQLVQRLNDRLLDRLQAERSPDRRALIAGFPAQVASLEAPLVSFLAEAFDGSRLDPGPMLRGAYFTSGTQEGTPIDRLTGALARAFGIDQQRAPSLRPEQGRSYFLTRLLNEVIFGEAMLVARDPAATRRAWMLRAGLAGLAGLAVIVGTAALVQTRQANQAAIARANTVLAAYDKTAAGISPLEPVRDADFARIVPLLDQARSLPYGAADKAGGSQWFPGLSQTGKLGTGASVAYRHALDNVLLPRLVWRLEQQMRVNFNNPSYLYEVTRVYLMLGSDGPLDPDSVRAWMHYDWQTMYPGPGYQTLRADLETHLAALLGHPLPPITLDGALVEDARRTFSRVPLANRVYAAIERSSAAAAVPGWSPSTVLGAGGARLFERPSGKSMNDPVPGFYTLTGFHTVLLPMLPVAAKQVASDSWVLGKQSEIRPDSPQVLNLERDVVALYVRDYEKQWDALLNDLTLAPLGQLRQSIDTLYILGSPQSPLKDLVTGIARQLTLSQPLATPANAGAAAQAVAKSAVAAEQAVTGATARLQGIIGQAAAAPPSAPPGEAVDEHYAALRQFASAGLDRVLKLINDLQQQLTQIAQAEAGGGAAPAVLAGPDPGALLGAEASQDPEPVAHWLRQLAAVSATLRGGGAKAQAAAAFGAPGGPATLCRAAVSGRYPFSPGSSEDVPLEDFARLFAPGGLLDSFFNAQLRPFVDTARPVWKAQAVGGVAPPVSSASVAAFQRAAKIRDIFFAGGGNQPSVHFTIAPASLDSRTKQVTLDLGGQAITYAHGPIQASSVTWPGPDGMNRVRLVFDPAPQDGSGVLEATGPWALFRLFGMGDLRQAGSAERYTLSFRSGQRRAEFELRAGSVLNPFIPGVLSSFRCPGL